MKVKQWVVISKNGITRVRQSKPDLGWDELAMQIELDIPDELFKRPTLAATLTVKDVPNNAYRPDVVVNTAELIEQQTGAKIEFTVIQADELAESVK